MRYILCLLLLSSLLLTNCERDDICPEDTPTTPQLIIRFYDLANPDNFKSVPNFRIQGVGNENFLGSYAGTSATDSIALPLRTDAFTTEYLLHKNYSYDDNDTPNDTSDDIIGGNEDIITVSYDTESVYVSRACGYKTVFRNVEITVTNDGDTWIQLVQPVNDIQSVENETAANFKIWN